MKLWSYGNAWKVWILTWHIEPDWSIAAKKEFRI